MLKMMFKISQDVENINMTLYHLEATSCTEPNFKMKVDFTDKQRMYKSPYYLCNQLWDKLCVSTQLSRDVYEFNRNIKKVDSTCL